MPKPAQYDLAEILIFDSIDEMSEDLREEFEGEDYFEELLEHYEETQKAIEAERAEREIEIPPEKEPIPDFETLKREMGIPTLAKPKRKVPSPPRKKSGAFAPKKIGRKKWKTGYWRDSKGRFTKKPRGLK